MIRTLATLALLVGCCAAAFGQTVEYEPKYHEDELVIIRFDPGDAAKVAVFWNVVDEDFGYDQVVFADGRQTLYAAAPPAKYVIFANILTEDADGTWRPKTERIRITVTKRGDDDDDDDDEDEDEDDDEDDEDEDDTDVPADRFDNLGRAVSGWATELKLKKRGDVGTVYRRAAASLTTIDPNISMTIDEAARFIREEVSGIVGSDTAMEAGYKDLGVRVAPRWDKHIKGVANLTKFDVADFFKAMGAGLGK